MIKSALSNIRQYLEKKVKETYRLTDPDFADRAEVKIDAVSKDGPNPDLLITLLRYEEEASIKQQSVYRYSVNSQNRNEVNGRVANPDICLNLYILISSFTQDYETGLSLISDVIFWINSINHRRESAGDTSEDGQIDGFVPELEQMSIELQSLSMEQNNNLWQTLGSKMVPAAVYKVRMLTISQKTLQEKPGVIRNVRTRTSELSPMRIKLWSGEHMSEDDMAALGNEIIKIYAASDNSTLELLDDGNAVAERIKLLHQEEFAILKEKLNSLKSLEPLLLTVEERKAVEKGMMNNII